MPRWPPPEYHVHVTFRAPRDFVYRWCTDVFQDLVVRYAQGG